MHLSLSSFPVLHWRQVSGGQGLSFRPYDFSEGWVTVSNFPDVVWAGSTYPPALQVINSFVLYPDKFKTHTTNCQAANRRYSLQISSNPDFYSTMTQNCWSCGGNEEPQTKFFWLFNICTCMQTLGRRKKRQINCRYLFPQLEGKERSR